MSWTLANECNLVQNYFQPRCNCINAPLKVRNAAANMLAPYYCWYAPCLSSTAIKSPEIIAGQLECKITNCSITVGEISISGGIVNIENNCAKDIASILGLKNVNVSLEKVKIGVQIPAFAYRWMLILLVFFLV